jgi:hypothetical protein
MVESNPQLINRISNIEVENIYESSREKNRKRNDRTLTKLCSGFVAGSAAGMMGGYINSIFYKTKDTYQTIDISLETNPVFEFINTRIIQNFPDFYNKAENLYENLKFYGNNIVSNITSSEVYTNNKDSIALGLCVALGVSALVYLVMDSVDHHKLSQSLDIEYEFYKNKQNL